MIPVMFREFYFKFLQESVIFMMEVFELSNIFITKTGKFLHKHRLKSMHIMEPKRTFQWDRNTYFIDYKKSIKIKVDRYVSDRNSWGFKWFFGPS
jgi:hypothetical protein